MITIFTTSRLLHVPDSQLKYSGDSAFIYHNKIQELKEKHIESRETKAKDENKKW